MLARRRRTDRAPETRRGDSAPRTPNEAAASLASLAVICRRTRVDPPRFASRAMLVMKELDTPWLHWEGHEDTADSDASFCGINNAVWAEPGGAMNSTAPNGRFDLCLSRATATTTVQSLDRRELGFATLGHQ